MARLMLSAGMFSALAATMAVRRRGFLSGSPPLLAAMAISLIRRVKILPRLASSAPFLCLMVAHLEWPDIGKPQNGSRIGGPENGRITQKTMKAIADYSMAESRRGRASAGMVQWITIRLAGQRAIEPLIHWVIEPLGSGLIH